MKIFPSMKQALWVALVLWTANSALAGDPDVHQQTLRGLYLALLNPTPEAPEQRSLRLRAAASAPIVMVDAQRIDEGARLELTVRGDLEFSQHFDLPSVMWRPWRGGWRYDDPQGDAGPVRSIRFVESAERGIRLGIRIDGSRGDLALVAPDAADEADVTLSFASDLRYCVQFGSDGRVRNWRNSFRIGAVREEGCPEPITAGSFVALSYNVAGLPEDLSGSEPSIHMGPIGERLDEFDLVLVQESWHTPDPNLLAPLRVYHEILEAAANHPFRSVPAALPLQMDPQRPTAFVSDGLNRFSRLPFTAVRRERWADCFGVGDSGADCLALKGFSVARMFLAPGLEVDVYNLHGEAGGSGDDELLRADNYQQLAAFINANSVGRAIVLGGDTNLHTRGDRVDPPDVQIWNDFLAATGLTDACEAAAQNDCDEFGVSQIDKFAFRSHSAIALTPVLHRFRDSDFQREDGTPLSDHSPLEVEFTWQRLGAP